MEEKESSLSKSAFADEGDPEISLPPADQRGFHRQRVYVKFPTTDSVSYEGHVGIEWNGDADEIMLYDDPKQPGEKVSIIGVVGLLLSSQELPRSLIDLVREKFAENSLEDDHGDLDLGMLKITIEQVAQPYDIDEEGNARRP